MGRDLLDVLVPIGLIAWWAIISVCARDNTVIPFGARLNIMVGRANERLRVTLVANAEAFLASMRKAQACWDNLALAVKRADTNEGRAE